MSQTSRSASRRLGSLRVVLRTHPRSGGKRTRANVLDCGGPPPLFEAPGDPHAPVESARGLAHSKPPRTSTTRGKGGGERAAVHTLRGAVDGGKTRQRLDCGDFSTALGSRA